SSRRRHTRFSRDWSSDVCSSDLRSGEFIVTGELLQVAGDSLVNLSAQMRQSRVAGWISAVPEEEMIIFEPEQTKATITVFTDVRSEERRVGKECRCRWSRRQ